MTEPNVSNLADNVTRLEVSRQKAMDKQESGHREFVAGLSVMAVGVLLFLVFGLNLVTLIIVVGGLLLAIVGHGRQRDAKDEVARLNGKVLEARDDLAKALGEEPAEVVSDEAPAEES